MSKVYFITHPEVVVDAERPVTRWCLSARGIERMRVFASSTEMKAVTSIWASEETKAIEAAGLLGGALGLPTSVLRELHENDRRSTGFLPPHEFEQVANQFFARPDASVRGWERAVDAQDRIRAAFETIAATTTHGDIAIVGHGGVGTLLLCHLIGAPIDRTYDQPFQGHFWTYSLETRTVLHHWLPIAPR